MKKIEMFKNELKKISSSPRGFGFEITLTSNLDVCLPIYDGGTSYNHDFTVFWGDGTHSKVISYDDVNACHTYSESGVYNIVIDGLCEYFCAETDGSMYNNITKINHMTYDIGLKLLRFKNCSNLTYIDPSFRRLNSLISGYQMFKNCGSLLQIPPRIFFDSGLVVDFNETFSQCVNITSIPLNLFKTNTLVSDFTLTFEGCSITNIPLDLFKYNINVDTFYSVFNGNPITSIPLDIFKYNTNATVFSGCFYGTNISTIPQDTFKYNVNATDFYLTFGGCHNLISVPSDLFKYNVNAVNFNAVFKYCDSLTTIPSGIFEFNINALDFTECFSDCTSLELNPTIFYQDGDQSTRFINKSMNFNRSFYRTVFSGISGTAPDLWNCDFGTGVPNKSICFGGLGNNGTSISNYDSIPLDWK